MLCAHEIVQTYREEGAWLCQLFKGAGFPGLEPTLQGTQSAECGLSFSYRALGPLRPQGFKQLCFKEIIISHLIGNYYVPGTIRVLYMEHLKQLQGVGAPVIPISQLGD